jgi:hypothetical protein
LKPKNYAQVTVFHKHENAQASVLPLYVIGEAIVCTSILIPSHQSSMREPTNSVLMEEEEEEERDEDEKLDATWGHDSIDIKLVGNEDGNAVMASSVGHPGNDHHTQMGHGSEEGIDQEMVTTSHVKESESFENVVQSENTVRSNQEESTKTLSFIMTDNKWTQ